MTEENKTANPRFPVFHVPHDGLLIQGRIGMFCVPEEKVRYYHDQMRDKHVAELIPPEYRNRESTVRFHFSRLMCDVERRKGPDEIMERYGMGVSYEKAYDGTVINRKPWARWEILQYYGLHHGWMNIVCARHPRVLLIDLHSYHDDIVLPDFRIPGRRFPDLCIGMDSRFTPPDLLAVVLKRFKEIGLTTDVNYPYSGTYIPEVMEGETDTGRFAGIMLEFHRRAYLDRKENMEKIREAIRKVIADAAYI